MRTTPFLLAIAALALGGAPLSAEDKPKELRIGAISASDGRPVTGGPQGYLAQNALLEEEFKADGIKVTWVYLRGAGPAVNESFANNSIDIGMYGDFPGIVGQAGGLDTRLILGYTRASDSSLVVPIGSSATSLADLKGKRIGIHRGRPWEFALAHLIEEQGFKPSDFRIFNIAAGDGDAAIAANTIESNFASGKGTLLVDRGLGKVIWSTQGKGLEWKFTSGIFVRGDFARRYPSIVQRYVNRHVKASAYLSDPANLEEGYRLDARSSGNYSVTVRDADGLPYALRNSPVIDDYFVAHHKACVAYAKQKGFIKREIDVDAWIDRSFLDRALKEQNLESYFPRANAEGVYPDGSGVIKEAGTAAAAAK